MQSNDIVFLSGCWDLFHIGHLCLIEKASTYGLLIVGVVTDEFALSYGKKVIIPFEERRRIIAALGCVGLAVPHPNFEDMTNIYRFNITIRVVGPEHGDYVAQRRARVKAESHGVRYVEIPRTPGISSTSIKQACYAQILGKGEVS